MKRGVAACVPGVHVCSVEKQVLQVLNHPVSTNLGKFSHDMGLAMLAYYKEKVFMMADPLEVRGSGED